MNYEAIATAKFATMTHAFGFQETCSPPCLANNALV